MSVLVISLFRFLFLHDEVKVALTNTSSPRESASTSHLFGRCCRVGKWISFTHSPCVLCALYCTAFSLRTGWASLRRVPQRCPTYCSLLRRGWGCSCYRVSIFTLLSVVPLSLVQKLFSQSSFIFQEHFSMCRYICSVSARGGEFRVFLTSILGLVRA